MSYICDICNSVISNKYLLKKHKGTEYCQKIKKEKEYYDNIQNFNNKLQNLENKIFIYESQLNEKDIENKILKEKLKEYKIILEDIFNPVKNVNKTITNNSNINNNIEDRIKNLENKVIQRMKRESYENNNNVIYIVTNKHKKELGHYKIGKTQDLKKRLSTYNTTDNYEVIYNISCKNKNNMDLLEKIIHLRLDEHRIEQNKEWFLSNDNANYFIKIIDECKNFIDK
jgi:hypothetical protein